MTCKTIGYMLSDIQGWPNAIHVLVSRTTEQKVWWTDKRTEQTLNGQNRRQTDTQTNTWTTDAQISREVYKQIMMEGRTDRPIYGWTDGRTKRRKKKLDSKSSFPCCKWDKASQTPSGQAQRTASRFGRNFITMIWLIHWVSHYPCYCFHWVNVCSLVVVNLKALTETWEV